MNTQEAFEYSVRHLASQGGPSYGYENCLYRSRTPGKKCAIGWLIPDGLYKAEFEVMTLHSLMETLSDSKIFEGLDFKFLKDLQLAHDRFFPFVNSLTLWESNFKHDFKNVGQTHSLDTAFINDLEVKI